jgi:predicted TIM-barrel fold metal-dependent hydrolase
MSDQPSVYDPAWTGVIDAHVHVFSDPIGDFADFSQKWTGLDRANWNQLKSSARTLTSPVFNLLHRAYVGLRHFPGAVRFGVEELGALAPAPALLVESSFTDLISSMDEQGVRGAVLIAHPPFLSNATVLQLASAYPDRIVPALNFSRLGSGDKDGAVRDFREAINETQGRLLLKIHAAADGEPATSELYQGLLELASEFSVPVILHTGCLQAHLIHRNPSHGNPARFRGWFADFPRTQFILAHMNMHEPSVALELGEEFENIFVDTSWQPAEVIGEAVRRIGAKRVLFASDWPLLGGNQKVAMRRLEEAHSAGYITDAEFESISSKNLLEILRTSAQRARSLLSESEEGGPNGA